jgi:hypothetical protein
MFPMQFLLNLNGYCRRNLIDERDLTRVLVVSRSQSDAIVFALNPHLVADAVVN